MTGECLKRFLTNSLLVSIFLFSVLFGDLACANERAVSLIGNWTSSKSLKVDEKGFNESDAFLTVKILEQSSRQFKGTIRGRRDGLLYTKEISGAIDKYYRNIYAIAPDGFFYVGYVVTDNIVRLYSIPKGSSPGIILYRLKRIVDESKQSADVKKND
jgi:hypothetical protein